MKRRTFLLAGLGTGGALFFGWALLPPRQRLIGGTPPDTPGGAIALNGWVTIAPDDTVTVVVPKAEMGQGIHTALAMLMAEELGCAWERVRIEHSPVDKIYGNVSAIVDGLPFHPDLDNTLIRSVKWMTAKTMRELGVMMTGGSSSVRDCWMPMREAGASARASLVAAAAARLGVDAATCRVDQGVVVCGTKRLRFGEVAADAVAHRPSRVTLKRSAEFTLLGTSTARLDSSPKSRGESTFGIDVKRPGMVYAAVVMSPTFGGSPSRFDAEAARTLPGVRAVVPLTGSRYGDAAGVAVIADSWWRARQGVNALAVQWTPGPAATLSSGAIIRQLRAAAATNDGLPFRTVGDAKDILAKASHTLHASYDAPYLAHATMEPMNATVLVGAEKAELWTGTQVPGYARAAVAHVTGFAEHDVDVHQLVLGGGFGRRLDVDYVAQATAIAKALPGVPVQTIWSREDDMRHDFYRPAAVSNLSAAFDANGGLTAVTSHSASQAPWKSYSNRVGFLLSRAGPDKTTAEGTWDQPYEFAALHAAHAEVDLPVPVGSWRAVGHSHQGFFLESFMDEIAVETKQDPVAFRASLLQKHPRARRVLQLAASKSGWGQPLDPAPDGQPRARGIALHASFASTVAEVAEVSIAHDGAIRVHRIVAAVDCGFPVNPNIITQQVESAIIYGLSAALYGEITISQGQAREGNFDAYRPLRIAECPVIETHIVPSMDEPSGIGEPALPPVAPAIANALFALTGTRLRSLPLRMPLHMPKAGSPT